MTPTRARWKLDAGGTVSLLRRGVDHGRYRRIGGTATREDPAELWAEAAPIQLRRHFSAALAPFAREIAASARLFARLAAGADPSEELWRRLGDASPFELCGASVDVGDEREIEKVHADLRVNGRIRARDLYAKVSWIRPELDDDSLRIRFSFGSERDDEWLGDRKRARAADRYCEAVFPESEAIAEHPRTRTLLRRLSGRAARLSERIVFANAPGGGARFHHDAEPGQLGVLYAQLVGATAWLALPKRALADILADGFVDDGPAEILERLDADEFDHVLNSTPALTRRLAAEGHLYVLRAGDLLLLPSHGRDDCAWHSVFGLGRRPSLAHSYGIFRLQR